MYFFNIISPKPKYRRYRFKLWSHLFLRLISLISFLLYILGEPSPSGCFQPTANIKKPSSLNNINAQKTPKTSSTTSSLDQFFESLSFLSESKPSNSTEVSSSKTNETPKKTIANAKQAHDYSNLMSQIDSKQIEYISEQLKLDTFKTKEALFQQQQQNNQAKNEPSEKNLNETAANLEMSLKNSACLKTLNI